MRRRVWMRRSHGATENRDSRMDQDTDRQPDVGGLQGPVDGLEVSRVSRELLARTDPEQVAPRRALELPWSAEAKARREALRASLTARLDLFRDDLRTIRVANEALNRASTMRALEAAEAAIFEMRTLGETVRLALLNRAQLTMARIFLAQIAAIEAMRGAAPDEFIDAMKERALEEFTARMNRASKADREFDKEKFMRLES